MYIKKSVLVIGAIVLIIVSGVLAVGAVNPFGFTAFGDLIKFTYVSRLIDMTYYEDVDSNTYMNTALQGVAAATGDPYTGYLWGEGAQAYMEEMEGNYQGIGVYIENNTEDDTITVVSAIAGTPAEEAGLTTGDKILKINGQGYTGQQINEAANAMRGANGTEVTITVRRQATGVEEDLTLTRKEIEIQNVSETMVTDEIGRINITQFTPETSDKFENAMENLEAKGMKKLIIDLRNNPGGLVDEATAIADLFIEKDNVIVYTMDKHGNRTDYIAEKDAIQMPVVLLTNQGSASASEILTGALKDYGVGYQIGEKTYGKGVVQGVFPVGKDSVLSVTSARYYTPSGVCIHGQGIEPDENIPMDVQKYVQLSALEPENDEQMQAAVQYLSR
ncbi:S41 family peptidase [Ructibacterium gallinarum]|uniref:S41 family peptidase n=1 Tax=Ructibacterium gallinarum TaxID=2779355 RepID=A0A9D5M4W0_9FIRM|nr:S41 family peptidase [Ructibacterium gallinarum]MBE5039497.1 S41 family peptidase [Ructibacterium gallinarum]